MKRNMNGIGCIECKETYVSILYENSINICHSSEYLKKSFPVYSKYPLIDHCLYYYNENNIICY